MKTFADRAAAVTKYGFPVIPLKPRTKIAFLDGWENLATTDETQIGKWNKKNPNFNCAAVGTDEHGWIWDVDDSCVFERLNKDTGHSTDELDTLIVKSSGEKRHFYFKHDDCSRFMGNRDCDIDGKEAFSIRAHNKYVVAAGSIHPETGEPYEIVHEPLFGEIPLAPPWLTDWIMKQTSRSVGSVNSIAEIIPDGSRNKTLASLAGTMRRRGVCEAAILDFLRATNQHQCVPPLDDAEVSAIARSVAKYAPAVDDADIETQPGIVAPAYPMDTIDGDLIGELTRELTDGTFIPPQFVRENLKVALGSIIDGRVGFPNHEDLHLREYLHNVSVYPQSGKGESYKRTIQPNTGFLFNLFRKHEVGVIDGGLFGSGEFMIKILKDAPTHRSVARFDEMAEMWTKNRAIGCTLEKKLLTLFESTAASQGSFKNGTNQADDIHLSLVGDFTKESFDASFTGSGSRGSGYLSRCIFQFAEKQSWEGDWTPLDMAKVNRTLSDIETRLTKILSCDRYVPVESDESKSLRRDFFAWLDTQDARLTPRLKDHLKRDALLRAIFSLDGTFCECAVFSRVETIIADVMCRSIEWCRNQLENRLALFPEDAGSLTEIMERIIIRTLKAKGTASEKELKDKCNVYRPGSGGFETFNRAIRSLVLSHEIEIFNKTRKGTPLYRLCGEN